MNDITVVEATPVPAQTNPEEIMGMFQKMMQAWLELPKITARLNELEAEVARVTSDNSWLRSERERLIDETNNLSLERAHSNERVAMLEKDNANLIYERDQAKAVSQALGSEVGQLNGQITKLVGERDKAHEDLGYAELTIEEFKIKLDKANNDTILWHSNYDAEVEARRQDNEANANIIRSLRDDLQMSQEQYRASQARVERLLSVIHNVRTCTEGADNA